MFHQTKHYFLLSGKYLIQAHLPLTSLAFNLDLKTTERLQMN